MNDAMAGKAVAIKSPPKKKKKRAHPISGGSFSIPFTTLPMHVHIHTHTHTHTHTHNKFTLRSLVDISHGKIQKKIIFKKKKLKQHTR